MSKLSEKKRGCYWCRFRKKLFCKKWKEGKGMPLSRYGVIASTVEELKSHNNGNRCWSFEKEENDKEQVTFT
jgi:hypothetical protein